MNSGYGIALRIGTNLFILLVLLFHLPVNGIGAETFQFERMWPTLQQPWYFLNPNGVAVDALGYVYVVDSSNDNIDKFSSDGKFVTSWGGEGSADGKLNEPEDIAIDATGDVYVTDSSNQRIQKFTADGHFLAKWGQWGDKAGEFQFPKGIAIGPGGNIYVSDALNHRVQKFTADGQFITMWGEQGSGHGQFKGPVHMAIDQTGHLFVVDSENSRIQKFTAHGSFVAEWGRKGSADGEFLDPWGIAIDDGNTVYVVDTLSARIQTFTTNGDHLFTYQADWDLIDTRLNDPRGIAIAPGGNIYIASASDDRIQKLAPDFRVITNWESQGRADGQFHWPAGVTIDGKGDIYVTEDENHRIQKFTPEGQFITKWGEWGGDPGYLMCPAGIVADANGDLFVVEACGSRVQKFTPDGVALTWWGGEGTANGKFKAPRGIAIGPDGSIYVADTDNHRVQRFSAQGTFLNKWGASGTGAGHFNKPIGIAVDSTGFVYVADSENFRIQKFTSAGQFVQQWAEFGSQEGQFRYPTGLWCDDHDNIYVADTYGGSVQVFTNAGTFVGKWGRQGGSPGQMSQPAAGAVNQSGLIYVVEKNNNRIQVFTKTAVAPNSKAIIMAGGGPFAGNNLWNATQMCANFAYRTLLYQGYTKESIYYLTSDTDLDLDNNGQADDVDGDLFKSNLQHAITTWAADAESVVVYLADHGGKNTYRVSGTETLSVAELDSWLDQLQSTRDVKVIVVYDACESGSFMSGLLPPAGRQRIVMTSTSAEEQAYFVSQGTVSFSNYFWTHIFNGRDINAAFDLTRRAIQVATEDQHPRIDANGNGVGNETEDYALALDLYLGNGTAIQGDTPEISQVSAHQTIQGIASAPLFAVTSTDSERIERLWAVIRPPDYDQGASGNPVQSFPSIELAPVGSNRYEATHVGFNISGTYQIAIYARNKNGNTSIPQLTTVSVDNPLRRRAIILAGGEASDSLWPAIDNCARFAYEALKFQGYADDDIYYLSPRHPSLPVDAVPSLANLETAMTTWAIDTTQDVTVYLVAQGGYRSLRINANQTLQATDLDLWMDRMQKAISGVVTVIYDADRSGSFLAAIAPPGDGKRINISSTDTDGPAYFLIDGHVSFSAFFWRQVLDGASIRDAFVHSINSVGYALQGQKPMLDDSGNGLGNEQGIDGRLAADYRVGSGILLAGDAPIIGSVSASQNLIGEASADLSAHAVTSTSGVDKVIALITPPGQSTGDPSHFIDTHVKVELKPVGDDTYRAAFSGFTTFGTYRVSIYAIDRNGNISLPQETQVNQTIGPDAYEDDDSVDQARGIVLSDLVPQTHNFHDAGDQDWSKFYAIKDEPYEIHLSEVGADCDVVINVYDTDGTTLLEQRNWGFESEEELLTWVPPKDGVYHVMVQHFGTKVSGFGANASYRMVIYRPGGLLTGMVTGRVTDAVSGLPVEGAVVITDGGGSAITLSDGSYLMIHLPGTFAFTIDASGYDPVSYSAISVKEGIRSHSDFSMADTPATPVVGGGGDESGGGGGGGCFVHFLVDE